jgi:chloramphenicol-sensitive protein RarD
MTAPVAIDRRGLFAAIFAFALWGVFPLYWYLLKAVPALQIIAHRIIWCSVFVVGYLLLRDGTGWLRQALAGPKVGRMLLLSSVLISSNWGIYIWAVTSGRVVDASLGYFINPLVNVLLGVLVLHERLNRAQWLAVAVAAIGVLWLSFAYGQPPWIALALACSFGVYGLIRKVAAVDAVPGLAIESLILFPVALAWLLWAQWQGMAAFADGDLASDALLIFGGALTALPLIGFAYGARRIPYSLAGLLQYIAPTLQLLCGVLLLGESFSAMQAVGFGCIWAALAIYAADGWRRAHLPATPVEPHCDAHVPSVDGAAPVCEDADSPGAQAWDKLRADVDHPTRPR